MGFPTFLLLLIIFFSFDPILSVAAKRHSNSNSNSSDLIHQTCKKTKYYGLCVSSLISDSSSSKADMKELAMIMVKVGITNATATNSYLSSKTLLISGTNDTLTKKVMKECADKYSFANESLQTSLADLSAQSYDYAYMDVMAAADYPNACHNAFKRYPQLLYPPQLARRENGFKRICNVILGIIDALAF